MNSLHKWTVAFLAVGLLSMGTFLVLQKQQSVEDGLVEREKPILPGEEISTRQEQAKPLPIPDDSEDPVLIENPADKDLARPTDLPPGEESLPASHPVKRYSRYASEGYGQIEPVSADASPAVAAAIDALNTGKNPELISAMVAPPAFDSEAWKDPEFRRGYISKSVPGRVWQTAQPGEGVKRIERLSPYFIEATQSEPVTLTVRATKGAPVTFLSFSGGVFEGTKLGSETVIADKSGFASATYTAKSGVIFAVDILAASPLASGSAKWKLDIRKDDETLAEDTTTR